MFKLMVVTDRRRCRQSLPECIREALAGGADAVQMRERDLSGRELMALGMELRRITREAGARLIVNHRVDLALALEADGVHLGWRSMDALEVRRLAGDKLMIGISCHDAEQVRAAQDAGADYAVIGPIFPTPSKEGLVAPVGLDALQRIAAVAKMPLVAIGGITPENFRSVLDAGAQAVAVISAIVAAEDPRAAAAAFGGGAG